MKTALATFLKNNIYICVNERNRRMVSVCGKIARRNECSQLGVPRDLWSASVQHTHILYFQFVSKRKPWRVCVKTDGVTYNLGLFFSCYPFLWILVCLCPRFWHACGPGHRCSSCEVKFHQVRRIALIVLVVRLGDHVCVCVCVGVCSK